MGNFIKTIYSSTSGQDVSQDHNDINNNSNNNYVTDINNENAGIGNCFSLHEFKQYLQRNLSLFCSESNVHILFETDYEKIREKSISNNILFEDKEFPPANSNLKLEDISILSDIVWLRPKEIVDHPVFFAANNKHKFNLIQGQLGDCWLLAALDHLILCPGLLKNILPEANEQGFSSDEYCGAFHFRFWKFGEWIDVIIDDRLPTYKGKLIYIHSINPNEFWGALLEKAYAKIHGSYRALERGTLSDAMEDLTGGISEIFPIPCGEIDIFEMIKNALKRNSLIGCHIDSKRNLCPKLKEQGFFRGHSYSILKAVEIEDNNICKYRVLRIRNPWGNSKSEQIQQDHKYIKSDRVQDNGEFTITYEEFLKYFEWIQLCHLTPDCLKCNEARNWQVTYYYGKWIKNFTAGGCLNHLDTTFSRNPQYLITLKEPDSDTTDGKCTVLIALMQKRSEKEIECKENLTIGFCLYEAKDGALSRKKRKKDFFKKWLSTALLSKFIDYREVCARYRLLPGNYLLIPSTFEPDIECEFLLRIFSIIPADSEKPLNQSEFPVCSCINENLISFTNKI